MATHIVAYEPSDASEAAANAAFAAAVADLCPLSHLLKLQSLQLTFPSARLAPPASTPTNPANLHDTSPTQHCSSDSSSSPQAAPAVTPLLPPHAALAHHLPTLKFLTSLHLTLNWHLLQPPAFTPENLPSNPSNWNPSNLPSNQEDVPSPAEQFTAADDRHPSAQQQVVGSAPDASALTHSGQGALSVLPQLSALRSLGLEGTDVTCVRAVVLARTLSTLTQLQVRAFLFVPYL